MGGTRCIILTVSGTELTYFTGPQHNLGRKTVLEHTLRTYNRALPGVTDTDNAGLEVMNQNLEPVKWEHGQWKHKAGNESVRKRRSGRWKMENYN